MGLVLSDILSGDIMAPTIEYVRLYPLLGIVSYIQKKSYWVQQLEKCYSFGEYVDVTIGIPSWC